MTARTPVAYPRELYQSAIYRAWANMKTRCNNSNFIDYAYYGGRGIRVCERWSSFGNFLADMQATHEPGLTLDRIDYNGDYSPENCRWVSTQDQANNKRNNRVIEYNGETHTLSEWARKLGINRSTLGMRFYKYQWSVERCLTESVRG